MKLYSVFVGIDRYEDQRIHTLTFACADAIKFNELIQASIAENDQHTFMLLNEDATRANILHKIGVQVASLATWDDLIFIHFSCHGSPEIGIGKQISEASRYLIPFDTRYDNIFGTAIDMEDSLIKILERLRAKLIIVFIDACFSGIAGGRTFEGPNLHRIRSKFRSPISLQTLQLGEGRIVMTAADDDQSALEDQKFGHGIFSYALFEALTDSEFGEDTISITTLYDRVSRRVFELSDGNQSPILNGRSRLGKIPKLQKNKPLTE
jgi:uncharacterized caspase-like protein